MTPHLLVLTDRSQLPLSRSLLETLRVCVDAGADSVVVRELDEPYAARAALVREVAAMGAQAIAAHEPLEGAVGVHLPSCNAVSAAPPTRCSSAEAQGTPRYSVMGRSCHSAEEVRAAAAEGATYVTLGPFAASASKPGRQPLPHEEYAAAAEVGIGVYALGGITPDNAAAAVAAGAHGVAVMGAVMRSADPGAVVADLLEAIA